jgi:enterochelin esterase family protein
MLALAALGVAGVPLSVAMAADRISMASPEVTPDRHVIIRVQEPEAKSVTIKADWLGPEPVPLEKGRPKNGATDGAPDDPDHHPEVWTGKFGPLEPGIYQYRLYVDGVRKPDPLNRWVKDGVIYGQESLFEVPGPPHQPFAMRKVPHGTVRMETYFSSVLGAHRPLVVYTPAGYDKSRRRYPVLYLLHGSGEVETGWTHLGLAHRIADNAIADGKAVPMIIVMPLGHALEPHHFPARRDENTQLFTKDLLESVIPYVHANYRVKRGAWSRAVAGLSMGGGHALVAGLEHPDLFQWVGAFSWGVMRASENSIAKLNVKKLAARNRLLWLTCGRDDFIYPSSTRDLAAFQDVGLEPVWVETDGGHDWRSWRRALGRFLPLIFKPAKPAKPAHAEKPAHAVD